MNPTPIIINPDGLTAKAKNPHSIISMHPDLDYQEEMNKRWSDFEANNPSYPLTEAGEPGKECFGELVKQIETEQGWRNIKDYDDKRFVTRQALQVVSNKHTQQEADKLWEDLENKIQSSGVPFDDKYNKEEIPEVCKTCNGTKEAYKAGSAFKHKCPDCSPSPQAVTEQSNLEEAAQKWFDDNEHIGYSRTTVFIAGYNTALSSKGLVERDAILKLIESRIKEYKEFRGFHIETRIEELTDLITKIKEI